MDSRRAFEIGLILLLTLVGSIEVISLAKGLSTLEQAWFSLLLVVQSALTMALAPRERSSRVVALLLISLSPPFSLVDAADLSILGDIAGPPLAFIWTPLLFLFPFVFVHFSLAFPVTGAWIARHPRRQWFIYLPFFTLITLTRFEATANLASVLALLTIPAGFLAGIVILFLQYRYALTTSEKNRLRVILIGCLLGGFPRALSLFGGSLMPAFMHQLAGVLLPLFPLSVMVAVVKSNFSEISAAFQRSFVTVLFGTGAVISFYLAHLALALALIGSEVGGSVILGASAMVAALLSYPLFRWGASYVASRFDASPRRRDPEIEPGEFRPIRPNPYVVGNPLRTREMFFGREEEFHFLKRRLVTEKEGCAIVLCGERRSGKTSILYQILNGRLGSGFQPVFIDMQGLIVHRDRELLRALAKSIRQALARDPQCDLPPPPSISSYLDFTAFLDDVFEALAPRSLLLLVDEYELIETKAQEGAISSEIFSYLSSLLERFPGLSLIFTGSRPLGPEGAWATLLVRSTFREVSFLDRKDADSLIRKPVQGRVSFEKGVVAQILRLTHGHPFFTQLICQTIVDVCNERQRNHVGGHLVDEAVQRVLENPPPQLLYQWASFSDVEKLVLSALAGQLAEGGAFLRPERAEKILRTLPDEVSRRIDRVRLRMLFESLRQRSVLDRDQTRYRFTLDLMRRWISSERNIWNVLNEISGGPS